MKKKRIAEANKQEKTLPPPSPPKKKTVNPPPKRKFKQANEDGKIIYCCFLGLFVF
jgi:hypothetical protein